MASDDRQKLAENCYIVISRVLTAHQDCHVLAAGQRYMATHRTAFGPASKTDCEKWKAAHCKTGH